jgi:hypothetical protein
MPDVLDPRAIATEGQSFTIPAPFKGLNTRDDFITLAADEARVLVNWLPDGPRCRVRPGKETHCDTGAAKVSSLYAFYDATGTDFLAAAGGKIYDVTAAGAPAELASGYTKNVWCMAQLNGYLIAVNGTDTPWRYDGSSITATGFSGATLTSLRTVDEANERLWFTENNSADVYYAGRNAISGALTKFQLSQLSAGGSCVRVFGIKDYTCFMMSTGQLMIYAGNPENDFAIQGKYVSPEPIASGEYVRMGGDIVILTASGPIPLELITSGTAFNLDALASWGKITPSWTEDYGKYSGLDGWNATFHKGLLYFNVPTDLTGSKQYIFNTRGQSWTSYDGLNAAQWAHTGDSMYFADLASGEVKHHATGTDDGNDISAVSRQGYTYPLQGQRDARYTFARFNIKCDGIASAQFALDIDFAEKEYQQAIFALSSSGTGMDWGDDWDSDWGEQGTGQRHWHKARGRGRSVAPALRVFSRADSVDWSTSEIIATRAGLL